MFKHIFGVTLLCIMLIKICPLSISRFFSSADPFAIEKNAEEGKDVKEEAFDKKEKKLYTHVFTCIKQGALLCSNHLSSGRYSYILRMSSQPPKTVPTPPPNYLS